MENKSSIKTIVTNEIKTIPGVDKKQEIIINTNQNDIDISFSPCHYICNIYDVAIRVIEIINNKLLTITKNKYNINILINSKNSKYKYGTEN